MSEKPLTPWVVCERSGKVLSAVRLYCWPWRELFSRCITPLGDHSVFQDPHYHSQGIISPSTFRNWTIKLLICIEKCHSKPALLSLIPAHSDSYIPNALHPELPDALSNLFDSSLVEAFLFIIIVIVISIVIIVTKLLLACTKLLLGKVWFVISWGELSNLRTSIFQTWIAWTFLSGSIHTHVHVDYNKLINWLKLTFYPFLISE